VFVFDTWLSRRTYKKHLDRISDFNPADDTIQLARKAFKALKKGTLKKSAFYAGSHAHDASDRIVYDKKKGVLYYDDDGNGAHKAVAIATLSKYLKLHHYDFIAI
jgi:Ca2+-binding RTX toxin-like protein